MKGGIVMMRVQNPSMMKSEHPISIAIITDREVAESIPSTGGNVELFAG